MRKITHEGRFGGMLTQSLFDLATVGKPHEMRIVKQ